MHICWNVAYSSTKVLSQPYLHVVTLKRLQFAVVNITIETGPLSAAPAPMLWTSCQPVSQTSPSTTAQNRSPQLSSLVSSQSADLSAASQKPCQQPVGILVSTHLAASRYSCQQPVSSQSAAIWQPVGILVSSQSAAIWQSVGILISNHETITGRHSPGHFPSVRE